MKQVTTTNFFLFHFFSPLILGLFTSLSFLYIFLLLIEFSFFLFFFCSFSWWYESNGTNETHTWLTFPNQYDNGARHVFFPCFIVIHSFLHSPRYIISLSIYTKHKPWKHNKKSNDKVDGNWIVCIDLIVLQCVCLCVSSLQFSKVESKRW